jgi:hypothetical protein
MEKLGYFTNSFGLFGLKKRYSPFQTLSLVNKSLLSLPILFMFAHLYTVGIVLVYAVGDIGRVEDQVVAIILWGA